MDNMNNNDQNNNDQNNNTNIYQNQNTNNINTTYDAQQNYVAPQAGPGMAIASMVLGIVSIFVCCCVAGVGIVLAIIGIVLGAISLKNKTKGRGMAIAGIILCGITILFGIVSIILAASLNEDLIRNWMEDNGVKYPSFN